MLRRKPKEPRIRSKMQGQEKPAKARMIGESTEAIESSKRFVEELLLSLSDFVKEMVKSNTSYNTKMNDHKVSLKRAMTLAGLEQVQRLLIQEIEGIQASSEHYRTKLEKANTTIKEQQEVMRKFEADATVDFLTQLANRRAFDSRLAEEYERMRRYGGTFSLILVDIDEFKKVNDEFGHLAGDLVLQFIARMLQDNVRISDCVGRYGGEEFAILLPGTSSEGARVAAEKIRHAVQTSAVKHENQKIKVTISAGVGMIRPKGEKPDGLIARVDAALYCAKRNGRNRVEMAEEDQMLPQEKTAPRVGP
jgi:diguanylate cyclase (GGDEF)-like protein